MYTEYHILVNMYHVRAQGIDECMIMYIIIIVAWNGNTPKSQHYFKYLPILLALDLFISSGTPTCIV